MLIDNIFRDDDTPIIYTRSRDENGNLIERRQFDFKPYFWVPASTPEFRLSRLKRSFPTARVCQDETATGLDGTPLFKIEAHSPYDVTKMREMFERTYEADVRFTDRWLIDNVQEMPAWKPRKWWYDIECDTGDDSFTTVIAVIDSDLDTPVVFAWADDRTNCPYSLTGRSRELIHRKVRDVEYELHLCFSERQLYENFIDFLHERDPDMMIAHAGTFFDIPHMVERLDHIYGHGGASRLSPLGIIRRPRRGEDSYDFTDQPIAGRWQFDTASPAQSGTGFERVWKDSGGGQLPDRKLNTIAEILGLGSKLTEEIEGMDVHNGWYEYWEEFIDYCLLDTVLLRGIDEARNVTDFYVEMVRLCGVSLQSACNVTNFARGLLSRRTQRKAASRFRASDDQKLKGAEVGLNCVTGLHEGVAIIDYKGLYPSLIVGHNLSYETKRDGPGEGITQLENGSYWDQREKGLLPKVVDYLFEYRAICKENMKHAKSVEERDAWNTTQSAVKRVMASLYGMTAHIGYGWADADIAHTITSEGRRCIRLLDKVSSERGYECLYGHTDSAFVKVPLDDAHNLAEAITEVVQKATGNERLVAELEAWMPYWLLAKKKRYVGRIEWPVEEEGKMKVAGFGLKASNTAPLSKEVQRLVFEMVLNGASEGEVSEVLLPLSKDLREGVIDIKRVSLSTRLGMNLRDYKTLSGGSKAADYYNRNMGDDPFKKGDSVKWTYVSSTPSGMEATDIVGFREPSDIEGFELDAETILQKMVKAKLKSVYDTLEWDLEGALGAPRPKNYGWW